MKQWGNYFFKQVITLLPYIYTCKRTDLTTGIVFVMWIQEEVSGNDETLWILRFPLKDRQIISLSEVFDFGFCF